MYICVYKRCLLSSSRCEACLKEYVTTVRLMRHLDHSGECAHKLRQWGLTTEVGPGINNKKVDKDSEFPIPVLPVEGPGRVWDDNMEHQRGEVHDQELVETIVDYLLDLEANFDHNVAIEELKHLLATKLVRFNDIRETFRYVWETLLEQWDEEDERIPRKYKVDALCESTWLRLRLDWYFKPEDLGSFPSDRDIRESAWGYCKITEHTPRWKPREYIPRMRTRQLNYVHLFSGERRAGDLQEALGQLPVPDGCTRTVLSVDIIFDNKRANLRDPKVQNQWLDFVWAGMVHALFVGPPCESWSRARALGGIPAQTAGDGGPRVLRSAVEPLGLEHLRPEEVQQLIVANQLLQFALSIFLAMLMMARLAVVEHPATPDQPSEGWMASIWRLWVTKTLVGHSAVQLAKVYQGHYHGISPKPTYLMVAMGPHLDAQRLLDGMRTRQTLPKALQMERGAEFATARLKNYPKDFCSALANLSAAWNARYLNNFELATRSDATFNEYVKSLVCRFNFDVQRGADYAN